MLNISEKSFETDPILKAKHEGHLKSLLLRKDLGFFDLPHREENWTSLEAFDKKFKGFQALVLIGIGGSALGAKTIYDSVSGDIFKNRKKVYFWENVDPVKIENELFEIQKLGIEKVGVLAISKSGNTIETLALLDLLLNSFPSEIVLRNTIVMSESKPSPLYNFAQKNKVDFIPLPFDVGGRFSVLTPAGLFMSKWLGLDLKAMQRGAKLALEDSSLKLVAEFSAQVEKSFLREEWITVFWSYAEPYRTFGFWLQQLWCESLAKKKTISGRTPLRCSTLLPCVGVTDQHSLLQQFAEGAKDKFIVFLRSRKSEHSDLGIQSSQTEVALLNQLKIGQLLSFEAQGTSKSLQEENISQMTLIVPDSSVETLGFLFLFFELVIASLGANLNINTFDQPGVERGKIIALEMLKNR